MFKFRCSFQYVLNPTFEIAHILELDDVSRMSRAYDGTTYLPGIVGLNNIKANDYCNVILQVSGYIREIYFFVLYVVDKCHIPVPTVYRVVVTYVLNQEIIQSYCMLDNHQFVDCEVLVAPCQRLGFIIPSPLLSFLLSCKS